MTPPSRRLLVTFTCALALAAALLMPATSASAWHWNDCSDAPADVPPGFDTTCPLVGMSPASVMSATLELTMQDDLSFDNGTIWQDPHHRFPGENDHLTTKGPSSGTGGVWRMESTTLERFTAEFSISLHIIDTGTPTGVWMRGDLYWDARPDGLGSWKSECRLYDGDPFGKGRMLPTDADWGTHEGTPFDCVTHKDSATPYEKAHITATMTLASLDWGTVRATLATAGAVTLTDGTVQSPIARFLVDGTKTAADPAAATHDVTTAAPLTFEAVRRNAEPPGNAQGTVVYRIVDDGFPTPYWVKAWAQNYKWLSFYYSDQTCEIHLGDPRAGGTVAAAAPYTCTAADVSGRKTIDWELSWTVAGAPARPVARAAAGWIASHCAEASTACVFLPHAVAGLDEGTHAISGRVWNTTGTAATRGVTYDWRRNGSTDLPLADQTRDPALAAVIDSAAVMYGRTLTRFVYDGGADAVTVAPHSVAWLEQAAPYLQITGDYLIHYEDQWYRVADVTARMPEASGPRIVRCAPIAESVAAGAGACTGAALSIAGKSTADQVIAVFGAPQPAPSTPATAAPLAPVTPPQAGGAQELAAAGGTADSGLLLTGAFALLAGLGLVGTAARRRRA